MARFDYSDYEKQKAKRTSTLDTNRQSRFSFFSLRNDGDEAVVKFVYNSEEEFDLVNVHVLKIDDRYRKIHCLRKPFEPTENCPLCNAGERPTIKFFVKLIEYTQAEDGSIIATPKVWERSLTFAKLLKSYFREYGDINEHVFKIKRHGARGDVSTTYDVIFANPKIFKPEMYVNNPEAFKDLDIVKILVNGKSKEEMDAYLNTGSFPEVTTQRDTSLTSTTTIQEGELVSTARTTKTFSSPAFGDDDTTSKPQRPVRRQYDID